MKRRAKYVFLSWLRSIVNKLDPENATNNYQYDNMEEAMEVWLDMPMSRLGAKIATTRHLTSVQR